MYRLSWFFSYLTYNLAAPLLLVTLSRSIFYTFFLCNLSACAFYFEARQAGFGPDTWVGANAGWFEGAGTANMYIYSLYWAAITLTTTGQVQNTNTRQLPLFARGTRAGAVLAGWAGGRGLLPA